MFIKFLRFLGAFLYQQRPDLHTFLTLPYKPLGDPYDL